MIVELLSVFAILTGGSFLLSTAGVRGWGLPFLGFIVGIALMILIGSLQVITCQPTHPMITLSLTVLIPMGIWVWNFRNNRTQKSFNVLSVLIGLVATAIFITGLYSVNLVNLTADSYQYAQIGSLFESNHMDVVRPHLLLKRNLGVPLMHAPANMSENFFLRSITPLLSLSTLLSLAWFCRKGLQLKPISRWAATAFPLTAALLLLSNPGFVYNAFYINGHVLYAAFLLLISGGSWLYANRSDVSENTIVLMILFAVSASIFVRPEASLHVLIVLLPIIVSNRFSLRQRIFVLIVFGVTVVIWNGFLLLKFISAGQSPPLSVTGMLGLGIVLIFSIPILFLKIFQKVSSYILPVTEIGLWTGLLLAAYIQPETFFKSMNAMIQNIIMGEGFWGYSLIAVGILFIMVLVLSRTPERIFLRFPVTTFIPVGLLLAFLRDIPYRVSPLDSLNRMFLHILPIAVLFIVSSVMTTRWGLFSTEEKS